MDKKNKRLTEILIIVLISCFIGMISGATAILTINKSITKKVDTSDLGEVSALYEKIMGEYYQDVDSKTLVEGAMSGMLSVLDKNSSFLDKSATNSFNNRMQGEYYGIGVEALTVDGVGILVSGVLKDSPAEKAGLKEGDIIISVNDISMKSKTASYFTSMINDSESDINIKVTRNNEVKAFTLKAEKITITSVTTNTFYRNNKRIGYIKISIFAANTAEQFKSKLENLESSGIDSLIIDVRNNAGGYLTNASTMLEMFMKKDSVLYKTETKDNTLTRKDLTEEKRDYPVIVLVNESSASASEILAVCFKENYGSTLVGIRTYGKGTVQETVSVLDGDSIAKLTTKKWLTPNGEWIDGKGITPDVFVKLNDKYLTDPTFENDNQLSTALNLIIK